MTRPSEKVEGKAAGAKRIEHIRDNVMAGNLGPLPRKLYDRAEQVARGRPR